MKLESDPKQISGTWADGYTLDRHTKSSEFLGYDSNGRAQYDSTRTELGEAVYQLKYGSRDEEEAVKLASTAVAFIKKWKIELDAVLPMPASKSRTVQPVLLIAKEIARQLGLEFLAEAVTRNKKTPELKNVDGAERQKLLADAHEVIASMTKGRRILLVDDLFQTGATMNAVAAILQSKGHAAKVYALAITRTKR